MKVPARTRPAHHGFWKSIQGNLILLLLLMLIPTIFIQAYIYHDQSQTRRAEELQANLEVARAAAENFESFVRDILHSEWVVGLALTAAQPITDEDRDRILDQFQAENPAVRSIFWINPGGLIVASSLRTYIGLDISDRSYCREVMAGRDWAVSELIIGKATGKPAFTIGRGIRNEQGELSGLVAAAVEPDRMGTVLGIDRSEDADVSLVDNKGMLVHRHPATEYSWEQRNWLKLYPVMENSLNGKEVTSTVISASTGKKRLVAFTPVSSIGWVAGASRAEKDAMAAITSALVHQTILFLVVTLSGLCGALLLSRSISAPIKQLRDQALQFGRGEKDIPAVNTGPSELKGLAKVLHEMAGEVRSRESELVESEEKFRTLFRSVPEPLALALWDEATLLEVNEAYCRFLGFSRDEVIGKTSVDLGIWPDVSEHAQIRDILTSEPLVSDFECHLATKFGETRTVLLSVETVNIQSRHGMLFIIRDITERKRMEEEKAKFELQNLQLQKAESLSRMAGAVAHHFNNQLGVVIGYLKLTMLDLPQGAPSLANLTVAMKAARRAAEMSSLMLSYLGQTPGKFEPLDLAEVCRGSLPVLRAAMPKGVALESDLPSPGPAISGNSNQIQQILANLTTNAWEAFGDGHGAIHLRITTVSPGDISTAHRFPIDWQPQDNVYACLEVADAGCGIADHDIEKIFDPFFSSNFIGRGLGLSVVLGIVRAHGGAVTVDSEPGRGSVFRVFFPVSEEEVPPGAGHTDQDPGD
jgi:PAS domain S-box-containing protein